MYKVHINVIGQLHGGVLCVRYLTAAKLIETL